MYNQYNDISPHLEGLYNDISPLRYNNIHICHNHLHGPSFCQHLLTNVSIKSLNKFVEPMFEPIYRYMSIFVYNFMGYMSYYCSCNDLLVLFLVEPKFVCIYVFMSTLGNWQVGVTWLYSKRGSKTGSKTGSMKGSYLMTDNSWYINMQGFCVFLFIGEAHVLNELGEP